MQLFNKYLWIMYPIKKIRDIKKCRGVAHSWRDESAVKSDCCPIPSHKDLSWNLAPSPWVPITPAPRDPIPYTDSCG